MTNPTAALAMPTLKDISTNDSINLGGITVGIASVGSIIDDGYGRYRVEVVLSDVASTSLVLHSYDTILSSYGVSAAGVQSAVWSQTKQA